MGLIAQYLERPSIGACCQVQVVVVLLQMPERNAGDDGEHAIAAGLGHRYDLAVDALCGDAVATELVCHAQRTLCGDANGHLVLGQPLQRQGGFPLDRDRVTKGHRLPCANGMQFAAPVSIGRMACGRFDCRFGADDGGPHPAVLTGRQVGPRQHKPQGRVCVQVRRWLVLQPLKHGLGVLQKIQRHAMALHHLEGARRIACSHGVAQSLTDHALALIPGAGSQMQGRHRFAGAKALLQHGAEEVVIAEPTSFLVKGHDKQVAKVKVAQGFAAALGLQDSITKLWTHSPQHRRPQQERLNPFGKALQHLFEQVLLRQPMAAGERPDERVRVTLPGQRHRRHVQPSRPTFGARIQGLNLRVGQPERHRLVQKQPRFLGSETQILRAQIEHLTPRAQPRQRDGRHLP